MKLFLVSILILTTLQSVTFYGYLKEVVTASNLVFFNKTLGYVECQLWGIKSPVGFEMGSCPIETKDKMKMESYSTLHATRLLHLEQIYRVDLFENRCIVYNGSHIYNIQILNQGYAYLSIQDLKKVSNLILRTRIQQAAKQSKKNKQGLWNNWSNELICLERENRAKSTKR
jgi:hypothetical protein